MFTPQEIQEQTFSKAVFGGYDMQQVDEFLEPLTEDYITLYKENSVLKAKMKILVEKLEEYRAQETQQSSATAEAEAKSAQLLKQTQAKCAAMLQNAEGIAQANAQGNAANVQPDDMIFLFLKAADCIVAVYQHSKGGRLHSADIQCFMVEDREKAGRVNANEPIGLCSAKRGLIEVVIAAPVFEI